MPEWDLHIMFINKGTWVPFLIKSDKLTTY